MWMLLFLAGLMVHALLLPLFPVHAEILRFRLLPQESQILTTIIDPFGQEVVGTLDLQQGEAAGDLQDLKRTGSVSLTINVASYKSNLAVRDQDVQQNYLDLNAHPVITFTSRQVEEAVPPRSSTDTWQVTLLGILEFHGIKREIRIPVRVGQEGHRIIAQGQTRILLKDFNVAVPTFLFFLKSGDAVDVKFRFVGHRQT